MSAVVPPGYKQTEVGVIPEDWEIKPLKTVSPRQGVGLVINPSSYFDKDGSVPMLVGKHIRENRIVWDDANLISHESNNLLTASQIYKDDLLIVRVGEPGTTAVVPQELNRCNCASLIIVRRHQSFNSHWLSYLMNSPVGRLQVEKVQYGTAQKVVNIAHATNFVYPVPPMYEQQRIAEALSDADALIEGLEQLISKKLEVKQGAMQKLFAPRDGWEQTELGELCSPSKERFDPLAPGKERKCVELEHISSETGRLLGYFSTNGLLSQKAVFRQGDVLFGKLRPYLRKYWFASLDGVCSTELWVLRAFPKVHSGWLYWLVQTDQVVDAANKSTGTKMPRAEWGTVKETEVYLPSIKEQTEIATILSDMDAEIAGLEAKLDKARRVKEGMMQDLLTGKVRLV